MPPRMTAPDAGVTLLELVIAIFVLSMGTVAAFRAIDQARHVVGGEAERLHAREVALNHAEELRLFGTGETLPVRARQGGREWELSTTRATTAAGFTEVTITASADDSAGARVVVWLPPEAE